MITNFEILKEIFEKAIAEHSPEEWDTYVSAACGNDAGLYHSVKQLLHAHLQTGGPLDHHAASIDIAAILGPIAERPGSLIGPYKLLEQIGEGGMGVVFMAEQIRPMRRKVALKIIKPGMDTKQVIARFEAERQALALMDHPNIAKVLDAGTTGEEGRQYAVGSRQLAEGRQEYSAKSNSFPRAADCPPLTSSSPPPTADCLAPATSGRPYFVMELVRGVPVTDYCDERRLSIRERLELFITICQAVQHAHQKGIIHRDLKPTNVLVTQHDGKPLVKVIDFGVAKATGQRLTEKTLFTGFAQLVGTPLYMSPEQAEMSEPDVDTRSDIYSLGVLLYELLTGSTPFDSQRLKEAAFDELRRIIREEEPPRPSAKLSTLAQQAISTISERRRCDPRQLSRLYQGELDWIVMKTLEKERNRRYETASALADDIERYLHDEPVQACPPSRVYRLRKFARRYRVGLLTGSVVVGTLILGTAVSTWQAIRATHAEQKSKVSEQFALKNSRRAGAIRDFLISVLRSPDPQRDGRSVTIAEVLERAIKDVQEEFADDQGMQAELLDAIAQSYQGLGLYRESVLLFAKIQELRSATLGPIDTGTLESMAKLAAAYDINGQFDKAISLYEQLLKLQQQQLQPDDPEVLATTTSLAWDYSKTGQEEKALQLFERVLQIAKAAVESDEKTPVATNEFEEDTALDDGKTRPTLLVENSFERLDDRDPTRKNALVSLCNLGVTLAQAGQVDKAIALDQKTLKLMQEKLGPEHLDTLVCKYNLAMAYKVAGRFDDSTPLFEEVLRLRREKLGPEDPVTVATMTCVGANYGMAGHSDKCAALFSDVVRIRKARLGEDHPETLWATWQYAVTLLLDNRETEAVPLLEQALAKSRVNPGLDHPTTMGIFGQLAIVYKADKRFDEALSLNKEAFKAFEHSKGPDDPHTISALWYLADTYKAAGRFDDDIATKKDRLDRIRRAFGPNSPGAINAIHELAEAYHFAGRLDDASPLREEVLRLKVAALGQYSADGVAAKNQLGLLRIAQGRLAEAETMMSEDLAIVREKLPLESMELSPRLHHMALALSMQNKFAEAEPLARECVAIREKKSPPDWGFFNAQTVLGGILLGQEKYAEAEPLLLSGYEGLRKFEANAPPTHKLILRLAMEHLVQLYHVTNRPEETMQWKEKLADFNNPATQQAAIQ